jgi:hypothetical protein
VDALETTGDQIKTAQSVVKSAEDVDMMPTWSPSQVKLRAELAHPAREGYVAVQSTQAAIRHKLRLAGMNRNIRYSSPDTGRGIDKNVPGIRQAGSIIQASLETGGGNQWELAQWSSQVRKFTTALTA